MPYIFHSFALGVELFRSKSQLLLSIPKKIFLPNIYVYIKKEDEKKFSIAVPEIDAFLLRVPFTYLMKRCFTSSFFFLPAFLWWVRRVCVEWLFNYGFFFTVSQRKVNFGHSLFDLFFLSFLYRWPKFVLKTWCVYSAACLFFPPHCIEMQLNKETFLLPIQLKCVHCSILEHWLSLQIHWW